MDCLKRRNAALGLALALGVIGASHDDVWAQSKAGKTSKRPTPMPRKASTNGVLAEIAAIKTELADLRKDIATVPTLAQAAQEASVALLRIESALAVQGRSNASVPEMIESIDKLQARMTALRGQVEYMRTALANLEQPATTQEEVGGGAQHSSAGMVLTSGDGKYTMTIGGYMHPRYEAVAPENFSSLHSAGFRMKRARIGLRGKLGGDRLRYKTLLELTSKSAPLLDFVMDMRYREALTIRIGQTKVPYTRSFLTGTPSRAFLDLSATQKLQRYDRDMGVWALGSFFDKKLRYHGGISNGAGLNASNSNIDMALALRLEGALVGKYIRPSFGDVNNSESPRLTVGAAVVHDLVPVPAKIAGIEVGNRDVDADGLVDNVRVLSTAVDAQFRYHGWDLNIEGTWRHERWGSIVAHDDNRDLSAAVDASSTGRRNYLGVTAAVSYFVMPKRLMVAARVSHGRLPLLGLNGRNPVAAPLAQRVLQIDGLVQLYRDGQRRIGFMYSLINYNAKTGADPAGDISHNFLIEAQLKL